MIKPATVRPMHYLPIWKILHWGVLVVDGTGGGGGFRAVFALKQPTFSQVYISNELHKCGISSNQVTVRSGCGYRLLYFKSLRKLYSVQKKFSFFCKLS